MTKISGLHGTSNFESTLYSYTRSISIKLFSLKNPYMGLSSNRECKENVAREHRAIPMRITTTKIDDANHTVYKSWKSHYSTVYFLLLFIWRHQSTSNHRICFHENRSCDCSLTGDVIVGIMNADLLISDFGLARRIDMTNTFYKLCLPLRRRCVRLVS